MGRMLLFLVGLFFQILSPCFSQQLASNTNQLNNQVANLQAQVNNVQASVRSLQRSTNAATQQANEVAAVLDYSLSSGTKCGPQTMLDGQRGWTTSVTKQQMEGQFLRQNSSLQEPGSSPLSTWVITKFALIPGFNLEAMQLRCASEREAPALHVMEMLSNMIGDQLEFAPFNQWHSLTQSVFIWNLEEVPIVFRKLDGFTTTSLSN